MTSAQIIKLSEGYFFLKINNLMKENELEEIFEEVNFLSYKSKFSNNTGTSVAETGEPHSNKIGVFLEEIYTDKKYSNFKKYYKKWATEKTFQNLLSTSLNWRNFFHCDYNFTLFSYYEDGKYYKPHLDRSRFTQIFWIFNQPKKFQGGQFIFTDFNHQIEIENNTMLFFPSWFTHEVKPVFLEEKTPDDQDRLLRNGRYAFTTFYS